MAFVPWGSSPDVMLELIESLDMFVCNEIQTTRWISRWNLERLVKIEEHDEEKFV